MSIQASSIFAPKSLERVCGSAPNPPAWPMRLASALRLAAAIAVAGTVVPCAQLVCAYPCNGTVASPPKVKTLVASPNNPSSEAWLVDSNCSVAVMPVVNNQLVLQSTINDKVEAVASVPMDLEIISMSQLGKLPVANFTNAKRLKSLSCFNTTFSTIDNTTLPDSITSLTLFGNEISSLQGATFPRALENLNLGRNDLVAIDFALPKTLKSLTLSSNPISALDRVALPSSLQSLILSSSSITAVRGTRFPPSLISIQIGPLVISSFEIRESDFALFSKIPSLILSAAPTSCTESTAQIKSIGSNSFCVISDVKFAELYGGQVDSSPTTSPVDTDSKSSSNSRVVIVACVAATIAVAGAFITYRKCITSKSQRGNSTPGQELDESKFVALASDPQQPPYQRGGNQSGSFEDYLSNDVRNDTTLLKLRLDEREVHLGETLAQGGFGIVYRGTYRSQGVAIKRLLPDLWQDVPKLRRFMDEIRLCASLDHPKIVALKGITWTSLQDLSAVIEYMPGGDLYNVLSHETSPSPRDWTEPWTPAQINCKVAIALDVAEAVVYLHSFTSPILHRDLKARNVLLDERGNAKLSDFGISRELSPEETMTHGVGTLVWMAPEVLMGERYTEKADIYSLGVLLVELDRCRDPYAGESVDSGPMGAAQLAVLVCQRKLQPSMSAEAPESVRWLAEQCLNFDAEKRPTAMAVFYGLHQITHTT